MRFMMLMIPAAYQGSNGAQLAEGFAPDAEMVAKMMKFNEDLATAGALISLDGLQPAAKGARIAFGGGVGTVLDGPFPETKEVIGGYWMIRVGSKQEALDWAVRCPAQDGDVIELRQVFDMEDFPADVQAAADSDIVRSQISG